ncbi:MAG: hypothetical protein WC158_03760 [Candidatus Paceibacterota bacterium]
MGSKQTHSNKTKRESVEMYANVFTNEWTVLRMPGWEAGIAVGEDDDSDEKELAMTGFLPTRRDALLELEKRLKELLHVVQVEIDLDAKDDKAKPECSNTFEFYPTSLNVTKERLED